jgi:hypothetical protein
VQKSPLTFRDNKVDSDFESLRHNVFPGSMDDPWRYPGKQFPHVFEMVEQGPRFNEVQFKFNFNVQLMFMVLIVVA